jgi:tetratricopeptide (TPR) repeat protein
LYLGITSDVAFGKHVDADEHFELALTIATQTGDPYLDGNVHRAIGRNAAHAGDFEIAGTSFSRALDRARDVGNTRAVSDSLRCLAQLANGIGDYALAEERAQQALHLSMEQGRRGASAATLLSLGLARERLGQLSNAAASYTEAFNLANELQIPYLNCDASAGLARVSLAAGDVGLAVRYAEAVLLHLQMHALAGCEEPALVIDTCHRVLDAAGDNRADEVLRTGAEILNRRISALPVTQRDRYLDAVPERRIVLRQWLDRSMLSQPLERTHGQLVPSIDQPRVPGASNSPPPAFGPDGSRLPGPGHSSPTRAHHRPIRARRPRRAARSERRTSQ